MELIRFRGVSVRVSALLFLIVPLAVLLRREAFLLTAFLSLSVHEAAHALLARRVGIAVESIEIRPFGFIARLDGGDAPRGDIAAVYAAGPVASLSLAAFNALFERLVPEFAALRLGVTEFNLMTAAINLLPAYPLDGGRLAFALCPSKSPRALFTLRAAGVLTGAAFAAAFALLLTRGFVNPTFALMGAFLISSALNASEGLRRGKPLRARLRSGGELSVKHIALSERTSLLRALRLLPKGEYALVSVLDGRLKRVGLLDETQLLTAAELIGPDAKLNEAVAMSVRGML